MGMSEPRIAIESYGKSRLAAEILRMVDAGETIWLTEHGREICKIVPLASWGAGNGYSVKLESE